MTQTPNPPRKRRMERYSEQEPTPAEEFAPVQVRVRTPAPKPQDVAPPVRSAAPRARQPIGRSADLQARTQRAAQEYDAWNGGSPTAASRNKPLYSDFLSDQAAQRRSVRPVGKAPRRKSHNFLWFVVSFVCLLGAGTLLLFSFQPLDLGDVSMTAMVFVNQSVLSRDQSRIDRIAEQRRMMDGLNAEGLICPGVYIDGVSVGGMTREQAIAAVGQTPGGVGGTFDLGIVIGEQRWSVNSRNIPLYRNVNEVVTRAYAVGRRNTAGAAGLLATPFQQRFDAAAEVLSYPVELKTQTTYDHNAVRELVNSAVQTINRDPVNAAVYQFDPVRKTFTFHEDEPGVFVDAEAIYQTVVATLDSGVYSGEIIVEPQEVLAPVRKAELMNSFGLVSSFTTSKTGNTNRTTNIALSSAAINETTVLPGETFSFNQATGERTAAKGYKPAAAISGGETFDEIGGGVCQTSTTLFNAVVRANLEIVSRKPHAWPSDYVPKGEDATVNWPNLDFKFKNNTDWPIFIVSTCDKSNKTVTVEIYGMSLGTGVSIDLVSETVYKKDPPAETTYVYNPELEYGTEEQTIKPRTGYRVETYKVWYQNGNEVSREHLHTSEYKMYPKTIEHNKPYVYGE